MLPLFWLWPYTLNTLSWCIAIPVRDYSQQPGRSGADLQICDDDSINIFVTCSSPATPPFLKSDGGLHPRFPGGALCHYPWMESMVILHNMGPLSRVSGSSLFYFLFWHIPACVDTKTCRRVYIHKLSVMLTLRDPCVLVESVIGATAIDFLVCCQG